MDKLLSYPGFRARGTASVFTRIAEWSRPVWARPFALSKTRYPGQDHRNPYPEGLLNRKNKSFLRNVYLDGDARNELQAGLKNFDI